MAADRAGATSLKPGVPVTYMQNTKPQGSMAPGFSFTISLPYWVK